MLCIIRKTVHSPLIRAHELDLQFCVDTEDAFSRGTWRHTWSTSLWMKKRRSAALHAGGETRAVCEEPASRYLHHLSRSLRTDLELRYRSGQHEVVALVFFGFLFLPPSSPLWLTIFYITTTLPGLGIDSLAKVLCDRRTCTKWKTTNLSRVFSSSRRSAAIAQILYGEHPLRLSSGVLLICTF